MIRFTDLLIIALALVMGSISGFPDIQYFENPVEYGLYYVCWYEYLKVLPVANISKFVQCATTAGKINYQQDIDEDRNLFRVHQSPKISLLNALANNIIPETYTTACERFAEELELKGENNIAFWTRVFRPLKEKQDEYTNPWYKLAAANGINLTLMSELDPFPGKHNQEPILGGILVSILGNLYSPTTSSLMNHDAIASMLGIIEPGTPTQDTRNKEQSFLATGNVNLSSILKEIEKYPYFGFMNCLMNQLENRHGENAIEAVINEDRFFNLPNAVAYLIIKRDNEFREAHGAKPFNPKRELVDKAQKWARQMASECKVYHSNSSTRLLNGEPVGENVASGDIITGPETPAPEFLQNLLGFQEAKGYPKEIEVAYLASNGWYGEIRNYPFPNSYKVGEELKGHIGNFTQTIWKDTEYVGYGYSYNSTCKKWFVAARYYPAGNVQSNEQYKENVLPPAKWAVDGKPSEILGGRSKINRFE